MSDPEQAGAAVDPAGKDGASRPGQSSGLEKKRPDADGESGADEPGAKRFKGEGEEKGANQGGPSSELQEKDVSVCCDPLQLLSLASS
jgi:hypothetical protein